MDNYSQFRDGADHSHRGGWLRPLIWIAILAAIAFLVWHFWPAPKDTGKHQPSVVVQVVPAARQDIPVYLDGLGTIQAYQTVTVHTQVTGTLEKVLFHEGQDVHAGDLLAQIDARTFQANYDQAVATRDKDAANLENARRDLMRYQNLGDDISRQTLDTQAASVKQLEATVAADAAAAKNAAATLSYTRITAPINGRTGIRQVDAGNLVQSSDANGIVVLTQLQPISVIFSLPQQNLQNINAQINQSQQKLTVVALGPDGKTVIDQGVLELVDNQIDQTTGTIRLKATFPNQSHMLWPGGFTNVRLLVSTQQNVLVIPSVAVQRGPQGTYVFVLQADKTVKMRTVTVGMVQDDNSVITDGIQDGEQIVTDGMVKLQDGSKVSLASDKKPDAKPGDKTAAPDAAAQPAAPAADDKSDDKKEHKHKHKDPNTQDKNP